MTQASQKRSTYNPVGAVDLAVLFFVCNWPAVRQGLQREYLAALLWAHGSSSRHSYAAAGQQG